MPMPSSKNLSASPGQHWPRISVAVMPWSASWNGMALKGKGSMIILQPSSPEMVLDEIAHVDFAGSGWKKDLLRSKPPMNTTEGRILPVLANAIAAFRHAPEWGGVLAFNEFGFGTVV